MKKLKNFWSLTKQVFKRLPKQVKRAILGLFFFEAAQISIEGENHYLELIRFRRVYKGDKPNVLDKMRFVGTFYTGTGSFVVGMAEYEAYCTGIKFDGVNGKSFHVFQLYLDEVIIGGYRYQALTSHIFKRK